MKTLIVFSTRKGTAQECAEALAQKLDGEVTVANASEVKKRGVRCEEYDKIILGSSVYAGMVQGAIKGFCAANEKQLQTKPVGLFFACMGTKDDEVQSYAQKAFPTLVEHFSAMQGFGGAFHFKRMGFFGRKLSDTIIKQIESTDPESITLRSEEVFSTVSDEKITAFAQKMKMA